MKKLLSIALIVSLGFATTRVVCKTKNCNWCASGTDYDTIADALNNANDGDEIIICPSKQNSNGISYTESDLNITVKNLYIHSKDNDPSTVEVKDNSGNPIFRVEEPGLTMQGLTITQNLNDSNATAIDINTTDVDTNLNFKDLIINSQGKGIHSYYLQNSTFDDVNITSNGVCLSATWSVFKNVTVKNSEFNQTDDSGGVYAVVSYGQPFEDNNFSNLMIYSKDEGLFFRYGIKDSNFTNFYSESSNDNFVVGYSDIQNVENMRFVDSNLSSDNGRGFDINGSIINSYFDDFNVSANVEAIYTYQDINFSTFKNFKLKGTYGVYDNNYMKSDYFYNGEINASDTGIYSSKELNESNLTDLKIEADNYGLLFSLNSETGALNEDNNLSHLYIKQTSNSDDKYGGIRFTKKINKNYFYDINISATEKALWLSSGGYDSTFTSLELNSSDSNGFGNSGYISDNDFEHINIYTDKSSGISFNGDVRSNTFYDFTIKSNQSNGIYGNSDIKVKYNNFKKFTIIVDDYGVYFKDKILDNNFTNFTVRVNNQKGFKFGTYTINNYFNIIDTNGTKGMEFNISEGDIIQQATIVTHKYEPLYFYKIKQYPVILEDLNLTSTKDNCIYVDTLDENLTITSTNSSKPNELNCSDYNGIQIANDSTSSLKVKNTNFIINADSTDTSKALIKAKSLGDLNVSNSVLNGNNVRSGIYISSNLDNLYVNHSIFVDTNDTGIYLNKVNNSLDIEDNNFSKSAKYGIYIYSVDSGFNKGQIKRNYFFYNDDYAVDIFDNNENDDASFEIWTNCFYNNQNTDGDSQAYTYDASNAKYDDGNAGNYWSDWNESDKYQIDPTSIDLYDNHPLYYCPLNVLFDARDADKNSSDRNISMKIAGKDFNLTIFDIWGEKFKGTVCSKIIDSDNNETNYTGWMKLSFDNDVEKNLTNIEVNHSARTARVHIVWNEKDESCDEVLNDDHNATVSTDTFAIRPLKYRVKFSKMPLFAGEEFDLNVSAISDFNKTLTEYNRSDINISAEINLSELNCTYPDAEFNLTSLDFNEGDSNNSAKFDEVGEMNLTIVDNDFDLADGGVYECNDSNECISKYGYDGKDGNGVFCCNIEANPKLDTNLSKVDIKVYDLNITRAEINTSNGNKDWIYMDSNLSEFNASPTIEITAFNKEGNQLKNFDKECLAKDMNVSFSYEIHNDNGDINLTYKGTVNDDNKSINDFNKTIEVNKSIFIKGDTNASYAFNVERNNSKSLFVVHANLKDINFTTSGIAKNENNLSTDLNISMYYGNVKTFDVTTNKDDIDVKVYYIVNDDGSEYKPSDDAKTFNWYLNPKHTNEEGRFSTTIHVSDGYTAKDKYNGDFDITVYGVSSGEQLIHIERKNDNINFAVFHLTIDSNASHWLWFSYGGKDYNDSLDTTCAHHFCFAITWKEADNEDNSKTVKSGEGLLGTEAPVSEYNRTAKGVKIYR